MASISSSTHTPSFRTADSTTLSLPRELYANERLLRLYETHGTVYRDSMGQTILHLAAEMGDEAWIDFLLSKGCDPQAESNCGNTPLHSAAQTNSTVALHKLAECIKRMGGTVDKKNKSDGSALTLAVVNNNKEAVAALLAEGADLHQNKGSTRSLLTTAIKNNAIQTALFLIEKGIDPSEPDDLGNDAFHYAAMEGRTALVSAFLDEGAVIHNNNEGYSQIHLAASHGKTAVLELFITRGIYKDDPTPEGATPLYLAAENGQEQTCVYLFDMGAEVRIAPEHKLPSLLSVVIENNLNRFASILIPLKIDLTKEDQKGNIALMKACWCGNIRIAELLIKYGGIPEAHLRRVLWAVCQLDNLAMLECIERNYPSLEEDILKKGETLYSLAYAFQCSKILAYLEPDPISYFFIELTRLAAFSGIKGKIHHAGKTISLQPGSQPFMFYGPCSEAIPDSHPDLKAAFTDAGRPDRSPEEIHAAILSGRTTVIPAGWNTHSISIVIQNDVMILCNRGAGGIRTSNMQAYVIDREKITPAIIREIIDQTFNAQAESEKFLYETLPGIICSSEPDTPHKRTQIQAMLDTIEPADQHTGNCCAASAKTAIRAALFIKEYRKSPADRDFESVKIESKLITAAIRKKAEERCSVLAAEYPEFSKPLSHLVRASVFKKAFKDAIRAVAARSTSTEATA